MKINLKDIPKNPGVYIMKNIKDKIIYIGKAKNLRNRVSSYFNNPNSSIKTFELVKHIENIDFFVCNNELEALILENNLIKKHKPKYNILLKDNKTYPYLKITNEKFPKITIVRSRNHLENNEKAYFFGPFPFNIKGILKTLLSAFEIKNFNIDMYNKKIVGVNLRHDNFSRDFKFENKEDEIKYINNINNMMEFLNNKDRGIIDKLHDEMVTYAENLEFEKSLVLRNRIELLNKLLEIQLIEHNKEIDEDVFLYKATKERIFVSILSIRDGKVIDKNTYNIENNFDEDEIFERLLISYYDNKRVPNNIIIDPKVILDLNIITEWFKLEKNSKVQIHRPIIKSRRKLLLDLGIKNLEVFIDNFYKSENSLKKGLIDLKNILNLKKYPKVIECFDISNIQGKDAVAGMSVSVDGKAANSRYRHFKITVKDSPDDFMMMREVLTRRYSKLTIEELPDLVLIDGGKGQLGVAVEVFESLNLTKYVDIISIAKREEEIFKSGISEPFIIDKNDEALKILIRTRDEVHRFGITYHRKLRSKRNLKSRLDDINGIGPKRKKELIKKFGTINNIFNASDEELLEILPKKVVEEIKNS
ncbi:excinuclease ABC subunit UvrC [Pseudostreptobacillus hongkongensis]|uniref:excinuclease ABC subunit UvrC n=1 Tax=Pseudostreptobacillus hongkongensis TaxID=1162717 RepID=UPI0028D3B6D1|nr:excinuclease ABC subunit UvrC [Pseudostreptobacillus hongkongensis]